LKINNDSFELESWKNSEKTPWIIIWY